MPEDIDRKIEEIERQIESITIQGATNVALATLEGMRLASLIETNTLENVEAVGYKLSKVRDNEPLARNAVKFILSNIKGAVEPKAEVNQAIGEFRNLLVRAKDQMKRNAVDLLKEHNVILTHCHSSTAVSALIDISRMNPRLQVVATETRPLFQGHKTANELVREGVKTTLVVDSAGASFIADDRYLPVEAVIVGCDELRTDGKFINKVGSLPLAIAAQYGKDEFYVITTLLKIDLTNETKLPDIEIRPASEVWDKAPAGLNIINPAFDMVSETLVTGYITEAGVLEASELKEELKKFYPWM